MAACTDAAVGYAKERVQFGRTIGTFQAVKHHCADMLVAAELATAAVWDAARAASDSADEFDLAAAMAAQLTFAPAVHNAQMNIQVHGGIGFTWEHDAHLFLRRALVLNAVLGSPGDAEEVTALGGPGHDREVSLDLPPEAEAIRAEVRAEAERIKALRGVEQRRALVESGLMVPHWPPPWGRAAGAVAQIVIDEELRAAGVKVPGLGITGWNIMTVNQYATPDQVERWVFKTLMGEYVWCQLFSEPDAGSDAAAVTTRGRGSTAAGRSTGRRCGRAAPSTATSAWPPCGPTPTRRSTRASPPWSSTCTHPASRCGRCARSRATPTSTRSSSTTCSCPTTTWWAPPTTAGRWRARRWATNGSPSGVAPGASSRPWTCWRC